ncbi:sodium/potassium-transporting ATPase subunit beta-3a isoform X1 [Antennarius striatus]|uniref:sodium/potassium-transporting ATPase subunit beta-3a isoform X1 n=1 Tax=Antennarius striatus TaxID=241820 RepID=UPI0035ADDDED
MSSTEDKAAGKDSASSWKDSIYNPRTGELLGRTASSWALILLFYLVFYCFLAGMFALTMWVLLLTLDDNAPRYQDRVPSPGLVIRPNSLDIAFNKSDPQKYSTYVKHLEKFLEGYNDTEQDKNEVCRQGQFNIQEDGEETTKKACRFRREQLSLCSGLSDTSFGYSEGKPCVLLKMNRVTPPPAPRRYPPGLDPANILSCLPPDHWPDAQRGALHQLHRKSTPGFLPVCTRVSLACSLCSGSQPCQRSHCVDLSSMSFRLVCDFFLHAVTDGFRVRYCGAPEGKGSSSQGVSFYTTVFNLGAGFSTL